MRWSWKSCFSNSHSKCSNESCLLVSSKVCKEKVIFDSNGWKVVFPSSPSPILLLVCSSLRCSFTGNLSSNAVSHQIISLGSGWILKWEGSWEGQKCFKSSRERASETWFFFPQTIGCVIWCQGRWRFVLVFQRLWFEPMLGLGLLLICWSLISWATLWPLYCLSSRGHSPGFLGNQLRCQPMARWQLTRVQAGCLKLGI